MSVSNGKAITSPSGKEYSAGRGIFAGGLLDDHLDFLWCIESAFDAFVHAAEGALIPRASVGYSENQAVGFGRRTEEGLCVVHKVALYAVLDGAGLWKKGFIFPP